MRNKNDFTGFTLVELMIAVAIVGIIAAVGYPSYQSMATGSYRSTAQSDLMALAAAMERHYNANFTYKGAAESGADTGSPGAFSTHSPASEPASDKRYNLTISSVSSSGTSYEIRAVPVSGTAQADDGTLYYFSDGRKGWDENSDGSLASSEYCWSC